MKLTKLDLILSLTIILVGIYFSFWNLSKLYPFNYDQERDYLVVEQIVQQHKFTLIGPRVVSSAGFYLGPWYYYFLVPFYISAQGNPLFAAYVAGIINITVALGFYFLLRRQSAISGFLISLIWLSVLRRTSWNVTFVPLFSLIYAALLLKVKPNQNQGLLFAFFVGLGINFHFQLVIFLPILITWCLIHRKTLKLSFSGLGLLLTAFALPFLPLLLFDIRHNFVNSQAIVNFFFQSNESHFSLLPQVAFAFRNFIREASFMLPPFNLFLPYKYYVIPLSLLILLLLSFKQKSLRLLVAVPCISLAALSLYSQPRWPEYYQLSAVTFLFLSFGFALAKSSWAKTLLLFLFLSVFIPSALSLFHHYDSQSFFYKKQAIVYIIDQVKPQRPNIYYDFPFGEGYGFGAIRDFYDKSPQPHSSRKFFVGYSSNAKHNSSMTGFGAFGVSPDWQSPN